MEVKSLNELASVVEPLVGHRTTEEEDALASRWASFMDAIGNYLTDILPQATLTWNARNALTVAFSVQGRYFGCSYHWDQMECPDIEVGKIAVRSKILERFNKALEVDKERQDYVKQKLQEELDEKAKGKLKCMKCKTKYYPEDYFNDDMLCIVKDCPMEKILFLTKKYHDQEETDGEDREPDND